jgi:hypothetical protein
MSNIDKRALREAAEKATPDDWKYSTFDCAVTDDTSSLVVVRMGSGHLNDEQSALNGTFIAAANPVTVLALLNELESKDRRIAVLEGELEVAQHDLSDTEDAMHIWAERAEKAESKFSVPVAYAPKGHIGRYLNGENSGCWVYGNPIGEDYDTLYMAAPNNSQHISRNTICEIAHGKCSRIPGATFYNAAEFALDEVYRAAAGKGE